MQAITNVSCLFCNLLWSNDPNWSAWNMENLLNYNFNILLLIIFKIQLTDPQPATLGPSEMLLVVTSVNFLEVPGMKSISSGVAQDEAPESAQILKESVSNFVFLQCFSGAK